MLLGRTEIDQVELGAVVAQLDEEGARERFRGVAGLTAVALGLVLLIQWLKVWLKQWFSKELSA